MKFLFLIWLAFSTAICAPTQTKNEIPKDWANFANRRFSFYAPKTLEKQDVHGMDSFVEEYRDENLIISFDYGIYSNDTGNCDNSISATVDGEAARICFYEKEQMNEDKKYVTAIAFPKLSVSEHAKLTFWVLSKNKELQKEAEKIVRSIKFKKAGAGQ